MDTTKASKVTKRLSLFSPTEELKALVQSENLPADGLWAYASVEVPDTVGDVVKIAGLSWEDYHNPPTTHLKITAQHAMELASGEPPIVGRVERFLKTTAMVEGKAVPALAFYMSWASDGTGTVTDLAKKYKDLYDGGYMESFSVGLLTNDYEDNSTGGLNYNSAKLYHIGAVTVPANCNANVMRSLAEVAEVKELKSAMEKQAKVIEKLSADLAEICKACHSVEGSIQGLSTEVRTHYEVVADRLDEVEAGVVAKSVVQPQTGDRKRVSANDLAEVAQLLKKYSGQ